MGPRRHGTDMLTAPAIVEKGRHRPSFGSARLEQEPCKEAGIDQEHMTMMTMRATAAYGEWVVLGGKTASGKSTGRSSRLSSVSNLPR